MFICVFVATRKLCSWPLSEQWNVHFSSYGLSQCGT